MPEPHQTESMEPLPPSGSIGLWASGRIVADRYEIQEFLGRGGQAAGVYRVFDRLLQIEVALKVVHPDRDPERALARLRREVGVARASPGPHLIRIFDVGRTGEDTYLSMEFLGGGSLRKRLLQGLLEVNEVLTIAESVLEGLATLHATGTVHRDVTPGNILFTADGTAKLADFGLVSRKGREETLMTAPGGVVGTLGYLSPEQARGQEALPASDLYALGVVLFEALAGRLPQQSASDIGHRLASLQTAPDVRRFRPETPRWFARIIGRLLEVRVGDRYESAEAVLRDLRGRHAAPRPRLRRRLIRVTVVALLCLPQARLLIVPVPPPRFSHMVPLSPTGIAAVGTGGERLWTVPSVDPDVSGRMPLVRLTPGGRPLLATVLSRPNQWSPEAVSTLSFLDPETGNKVKSVRLPTTIAAEPSVTNLFPDDPPRFMVSSVTAVDLEGQGTDDVLVSYTHVPEAPSYTVLYSPHFDRSRIVFYARGHHRFQGAVDLEGNGKLSLIFEGINNGWNWVNAAAAVRLSPWPTEEANWTESPAAAPDIIASRAEPPLLWYAILPRGALPAPYCLTIDRVGRRLLFRYLNGTTYALGFDGFPPASSNLPHERREELRRETYRHLRDADRMRLAGSLSSALIEAHLAESSAAAAQELWLTEYARRLEARILVAEGKYVEAEESFERIAQNADDAPEVAYEAAVAFHLKGDLRRAVGWYDRGMGPGARIGEGKSKHEFLKGEVLALVEANRLGEALEAVDRFGAAFPPEQYQTPIYREYVRWRMGEPPETAALAVSPYRPDLDHYWLLEFEFARGGDPRGLLVRTDKFLDERPVTRAEVLSLRAELLARLDRPEEAREAAARARELIEAERPRSIVARAHASLVEERARRLAPPR